MSIRSTVLALAFVLAPAIAFAAPSPIKITLASAMDKPAKLIVANGVFACADSACVTTSDPEIVSEVQACSSIARKYGAVTELSAGQRKFDEAKLAKCNANAKK